MNRKKVFRTAGIVTVVVVAFVLIGNVLASNKKKNAEKTAVVAQTSGGAVAVRLADVQKQPVQLDFSQNGYFAAVQQLDFSAENSGRITKVLVDVGSRVKKGQTLAYIKADALNVDLENAEAAYQSLLRDKQRYESAFKSGGVTQQQLDQVSLNLENAAAKVAQAKIRVNDANIRSSINGIVNKRYIEPGAVVSPGTKLFEIVDVSKLKLNITVNESQVANLRVGDKVQVKASVFPDKKFNGVVTFIAPKADNSLNFPVEIEVSSNPDGIIKAGMYGTATFVKGESAPVMLIPRSAFVGSVSTNQVFVADNDTANIRTVVAGRVFGDKVEILDGLQEGEKVITSGQINLADKTKITAIK